MNIRFSYLYRNAANYKRHHFEIFSNISRLELSEIEQVIKNALIDGEWFYVSEWNLLDLHFEKWDNEIDHDWHEYKSIEEVNLEPTKEDDISLFLYSISTKSR